MATVFGTITKSCGFLAISGLSSWPSTVRGNLWRSMKEWHLHNKLTKTVNTKSPLKVIPGSTEFGLEASLPLWWLSKRPFQSTCSLQLRYRSTNQNDINIYKQNIAESVSVLWVLACIQNCSDKCCHSVSHRADISQHYDKLVDIMVLASEHIPHTCKPNENTCVPGWTTYVKPFKDKSMYWKEMYDSQKPNVSHYTTYMMKKSEIRKCFIQP